MTFSGLVMPFLSFQCEEKVADEEIARERNFKEKPPQRRRLTGRQRKRRPQRQNGKGRDGMIDLSIVLSTRLIFV